MPTTIQSRSEITDHLPLSEFIEPPIEDDESDFRPNIIERYAEDLVEEVDVDVSDQEVIAPIKTIKYTKEALEALGLDVLSLFEQQQAEGSDEILRKISTSAIRIYSVATQVVK